MYLHLYYTYIYIPRQCVENGFGHIHGLWPWLNFPQNLKTELMPIGRIYFVAVVLSNLHTIGYGNTVSRKYGTSLTGLTWERYLHEFPLQYP
jgi:hypothetical protein